LITGTFYINIKAAQQQKGAIIYVAVIHHWARYSGFGIENEREPKQLCAV